MELYIDRRTGATDELDFECLRSEGIRLLHELCSENWTDFNPHDPGVTILEQCCYALTDLAYRTGFAANDLLAGKDGRIDPRQCALHPPRSVFPCRPATTGDYRKLIFCKIDEIENVVIEAAGNTFPRGLYRIWIRPGGTVKKEDESALAQSVRRIYLQNRNLCEDLDEVRIISGRECRLEGLVEISGEKDPAEILAELYHACEQRIAGTLTALQADDANNGEQSWDDIFDGPLTGHADIGPGSLNEIMEKVTIPELQQVIIVVPGVRSVRHLVMKETDENEDRADTQASGSNNAYRLHVPDHAAFPMIKLIRNGKEIPIALPDLRIRYEELRYRNQAVRDKLRDDTPPGAPPSGQYRGVGGYYSLQKQFPAVYGVNDFGVPASAPPETKARAAQLKAYLLFFDQIMANYSANLENTGKLFSGDTAHQQTYWCATVENESFPPLGSIYPENPLMAMESVLREHDPSLERKSRMLDYLLALYGESFPQQAYRQYNIYTHAQKQDQDIVEQKAAFLNDIVRLTQDRSQAFDYEQTAPADPEENIPGPQRRSGLLLGMDTRVRSLTEPLSQYELRITQISAADIFEQITAGEDRLSCIKLDEHVRLQESQDHSGMLHDVFSRCNYALPEDLLRKGIEMEAYRLLNRGDGAFDLLLGMDNSSIAGNVWLKLGTFTDCGAANGAANQLQHFLININRRCEGMFLIEHILLRGKTQTRKAGMADRLSFRISVVLPAWTARTQDTGFRSHAAQIIRACCPAHIAINCLWLDFESMSHFELLHEHWRHCFESGIANADADDARLNLLNFFLHCETLGESRK